MHCQSGRVVLKPAAAASEPPEFLGAERATNNTAELTAIAKALEFLLQDQSGRPALIRYDSKYAGMMALGHWRARTNRSLVRRVHALWHRARSHLCGQLWASHVYGHSNHKWNDRADELARLGKSQAGAQRRRPRAGVG